MIRRIWEEHFKGILITGLCIVICIILCIVLGTKKEVRDIKITYDDTIILDKDDVVDPINDEGHLPNLRNFISGIFSNSSDNTIKGYDNALNAAVPMLAEDAVDAYAGEDYAEEEAAVDYTDSKKSARDKLASLVESKGDQIHWTHDVEVETTNYNLVEQEIKTIISGVNGYVESANVVSRSVMSGVSGKEIIVRSGHFTIRIPEKNVPKVEGVLSEYGEITYSNVTPCDNSKSYIDAKAKIKEYELEKGKLEDLLKNAENISDILQINDRLSFIDSQLDMYYNQKSDIEEDTKYSTFNLRLKEVKYYKDTVEKYRFEIGKSWREVFEGFIMVILPVAILLFVIIIPFITLIAKITLNASKKKIDYKIEREYAMYLSSANTKRGESKNEA